MQNKNQNLLNDSRKRNEQKKSEDKQQNNLFQFEMGNELGANIEQEKTMFKDEYNKDKQRNKNRQNNNFNTNKNQFK
ncbi:MAG: hypothetical protein ACI4U3_00320 [Traorella sp.]